MITRITAALVAFLLFAIPARADMIVMAQLPCIDTKQAEDVLAKKYHEITSAFGVTKNGELVRLFISDHGTFTVLLSKTIGISCFVSAGESWTTDKPAIQGDPT
jgi:hypothetical protein